LTRPVDTFNIYWTDANFRTPNVSTIG
jgi:hypothetical protein